MLLRVIDVVRREGLLAAGRRVRAKLRFIYRRLTFRPHVIEKALGKHTFHVAISNLFAQGWIQERLEWPELEWIASEILARNDFAVGCGANNGFTSLFFAKTVGPEGRVVAFEPLPSNVADIAKNVALNGLNNVEIRQAAVGRRAQVVSLLDAPNGIVTSAGDATIDVDMVSLDEAFADQPPDFIKLDVEGCEAEVLAGAQKVLQAAPSLAIEVHPIFHADRLQHVSNLVSLLDGHDYKYWIQPVSDGEIVPWDRDVWTLEALSRADVFHVFAVSRRRIDRKRSSMD